MGRPARYVYCLWRRPNNSLIVGRVPISDSIKYMYRRKAEFVCDREGNGEEWTIVAVFLSLDIDVEQLKKEIETAKKYWKEEQKGEKR